MSKGDPTASKAKHRVSIHVYLTDSLRAELDRVNAETGVTIGEFVRRAVRVALDARKTK